MQNIEDREDLSFIKSPLVITLRLGKRRWAKLDLTQTLADCFKMSKSEVKRIGEIQIWAQKT